MRIKEDTIKRILIAVLVPILVSAYALPVYWSVVMSLVHERSLTESLFPFYDMTLENFGGFFFSNKLQFQEMKAALINSVRTSVVSMLMVVLVSSFSAYAVSRFRFRGKKATVYLIVLLQTLPGFATLIPWYLMMNDVGLYDTPYVLPVSFLIGYAPFITWVLAGFFQNFPWEIEEAALVDGCSHIQAFLRVILPVAAPGIAAAGIITFIGTWNEFTAPLLLTASDASRTIQPAIAEFGGSAILSTVSILALIPPVVLAIIFQDYLVGSLSTR